MIKHFCNMCGAELKAGDGYKARIKIRNFPEEIAADYCGHCMSVILGEETFTEMHMKKAERDKRAMERKKVRLEQ